MLTFESDYTEGCHEAILKRLAETNRQQVSGYGADPFTQSAAAKITDACGTPEAQVYFLAGGTQTNQLVIDTFLQPWEGVIAATTGHVSVHEAGAIEYTGHKVLNIPQKASTVFPCSWTVPGSVTALRQPSFRIPRRKKRTDIPTCPSSHAIPTCSTSAARRSEH